MAHKVNPKLFRIRRIKDWDTRGYYKNPAIYLEEDFRIREFLKKKLENTGVEKVEIERTPAKINVIISSPRPGLIIGRGGEGVEKLKKELENKVLKKITAPFYIEKDSMSSREVIFSKKTSVFKKKGQEKKELRIEIREIKNPWTSASLSAQWIAQQIERRVHYRRVMKQALSKLSVAKEVEGAKIEISGRLNGVEIARREWISTGKLPRQTIRAIIDYAKAKACCTYGVIGVKVWIYKGEQFD